MKRIVLFTLAALTAITIVGVTRASAQVPSDQPVPPQWFDVSFPFIVGGKTLPAGHYSVESPVPGLVVFHSEIKGDKTVEAPVITRLATSGDSPEDVTRLVFDKVGGKYYASEFWAPEADGFLFYAAKEPHTHHVVKSTKK